MQYFTTTELVWGLLKQVMATEENDKQIEETTDKKNAENENTEEIQEKENNINLPRIYVDANKDHIIDIDNLELEVEPTDDWKIYQRIGRGKYSEVFEGKNIKTDITACVKILKPCLPKLLKLEIYTLQLLKNGPNVIQLLHTLKDEKSNLWCLVFELLKCKELKDTLKMLTDQDLRNYMYQSLKGLNYAR